MAFTIGGLSPALQAPPPPPPKQYEVVHGDTIQSIAQAHSTNTQALIGANPQLVNPDVLYPGDKLDLPAAAPDKAPTDSVSLKSTYSETEKTGTDANGTSSKSEITSGVDGSKSTIGGKHSDSVTTTDLDGNKFTSGTNAGGSMTVDSDKGTVSLSGSGGFSEAVKTSKGVGLSFSANANATVVSGQKTTDGVTTYTGSSDISVSLKGGVNVKQAGLEVGHTDGIKASYTVSMPEQIARNTDLAGVNPFDPDSMPTGTVIKLDDSSYQTNEFKATFKNIAISSKITDETGTSLLVEKTGTDTVRVTGGPTEAIKAYNGIGLDFDKVSLMLGNDTSLSGATLNTAEFDLSTAEGKAAFNDYVANGQMPEDNGPGVSGVKTVEKLDYTSQAKLEAKIGPLSLGLEGAKNTGNSVVTTYPDGSVERSVDLQYSGNVPMSLAQKFDANGTEIASERRYAYTIKVDQSNSQLINAAQTGDVNQANSGPVKPGDTVTISYTQSEMAQLQGYAENALEASGNLDIDLRVLTQDYDGSSIETFDFAIGMARNVGGSDYGSAERLFNISAGADGNLADHDYVKLPGTLTVHGS